MNKTDYARTVAAQMRGEPVEHLIDDFNDATRQFFKDWKAKEEVLEDQSVQLFKINPYNKGSVNPTETQITNEHGNIYNFGFDFAIICTEDTRQKMVELIKTFHEACPMAEASKVFDKIDELVEAHSYFRAFWV